MHHNQNNIYNSGYPAYQSAPAVRSATIPQGYVPANLPIYSRPELEDNNSHPRDTHFINTRNEYLQHFSQAASLPANPANHNYQEDDNNAKAARATYAQKMQAAVEQQRLPPLNRRPKVSQAFVPVHRSPNEYRDVFPGDDLHLSSLSHILNPIFPDPYVQARPPPAPPHAHAYEDIYHAPQPDFLAKEVYENQGEPAVKHTLPYPTVNDRWKHDQRSSGQVAAPFSPMQRDCCSAFSGPHKTSQSQPIATDSSSPLPSFEDSGGLKFTQHHSFSENRLDGSAAGVDGEIGVVHIAQPQTQLEQMPEETTNKMKLILPDRSEPGWHPPLRPAEKRRLERETSLISQPSPSNYQSSSVKSHVTSAKPIKSSMVDATFSFNGAGRAMLDQGPNSQHLNETPSHTSKKWQPVKMASAVGGQASGVNHNQDNSIQYGKDNDTSHQVSTPDGHSTTAKPADSRQSRPAHKAHLRHTASITSMKITPIRSNLRPSTIMTNTINVPKAVKASSSSHIDVSDSIDDDEGPLTPGNNMAVPAFFQGK